MVVVLLQGELTVYEAPVLKLISYDGNITQRKLGESRVQLKGVRTLKHTPFPVLVSGLSPCKELNKTVCPSVCQTKQLVVSPATDEAREAFSDLTTVVFLQQELQ